MNRLSLIRLFFVIVIRLSNKRKFNRLDQIYSNFSSIEFSCREKEERREKPIGSNPNIEMNVLIKYLFVLTSFLQIKLINELYRSIFIIQMSTSIHWFIEQISWSSSSNEKKRKSREKRRKKRNIFSLLFEDPFNQHLDIEQLKNLFFYLKLTSWRWIFPVEY